MRRKIVLCIVIVVCFLLQGTLFQALAVGSISPNLLVIVTASFGFMRGRKEGMWIGFFCGLLLDIFYGNVLGFYSLMYMYIGYGNGLFSKRFFPEDIKLPLIMILTSDFICNLAVYLFLFLFRGHFQFGYYLLHIMLPELVYTILVTVFLYYILLKINQKLEEIERRSASRFV